MAETVYVTVPGIMESQIGDTRRSYELGYHYKRNDVLYIYITCSSCHKPRWVRLIDTTKPKFTNLCRQCSYTVSRNMGIIHFKPNEAQIWDGKSEPKIGDVAKAKSIGNLGTRCLYYWTLCPNCGKGHWLRKKQVGKMCQECSCFRAKMGRDASYWRSGKRIPTNEGYAMVLLDPIKDKQFLPMAKSTGHVLEHRLVMARYLGRCLEPWEVVHHKNRDRLDNRIENLELMPNPSSHYAITVLQNQVKLLQTRERELSERVTMLEAWLTIATIPSKKKHAKISIGVING